MATGEMATDVGTILYGKEAVSSGLIDKLGRLSDALQALHKMIDKQKGPHIVLFFVWYWKFDNGYDIIYRNYVKGEVGNASID